MSRLNNRLLPMVLATLLAVLAASNAALHGQPTLVHEVTRDRSASDGHGDAFGDSIWGFPINESLYAVGVEFAWNEFFVTCGMVDNCVNVYDRDGNWVRQFPQFGGGGWRDMAWDGDTLYAAAGGEVIKFGPNGEDYGSFTGGDRALAYDPPTGHFWTGGWGSNIYEFDKTGAIHNVYANVYDITGMAWDDVSTFAPCLWVAEMTTPAVRAFDPSTGTYNPAAWFPIGEPPGGTALSADWDTSFVVLFQLLQSTPDRANAYEIQTLTTVEETPGNGRFSMTKSQLLQNYPNPFTRTTTIRYSLQPRRGDGERRRGGETSHITDRTSHIKLSVYDLSGRLIRTLADEQYGHSTIEPWNRVLWDGRNNKGQRVPAGIYFARLGAGDPALSGAEVFTCTRKMTLLR